MSENHDLSARAQGSGAHAYGSSNPPSRNRDFRTRGASASGASDRRRAGISRKKGSQIASIFAHHGAKTFPSRSH